MKERLIKNWITSFIGFAIIVVSMVMMIKEVIDYTAFGVLAALGLAIAWSKDGKLKNPKLTIADEAKPETEKAKTGIHRKTPETDGNEI